MHGIEGLLAAAENDEGIQAMKDYYERKLIKADRDVREVIEKEEAIVEEVMETMRRLKDSEFYEPSDLAPYKKHLALAREKIMDNKMQLRRFRDKIDITIRKLSEGATNVTSPSFSRPQSPPSLNTLERNGVFQESKQAAEPTLPVRELPEPPVLPLADQPGIFSRPVDTPLLPSQDARNIPRQSNPPPPPVNDSDPTRNLDQTSFQNGHNLGNRRRSPRPQNSNRPLGDDEDLSPSRGSPSKDKVPYYVLMMRTPRYDPGALRPPVPDYLDSTSASRTAPLGRDPPTLRVDASSLTKKRLHPMSSLLCPGNVSPRIQDSAE
jgi:hypothetical protein